MKRYKILRKVAISFYIFTMVIHIAIYATYLVYGRLIFDDLAYSELTWSQLGSMYPHIAYLISLYIRMMGLVVLIAEMFNLYGIYLIFWKSSKTAWILVMIGSLGILVMELIQNFRVIGFEIPYMAYILLTILTIFASVIGGIEVLDKKYNKIV